MIFQALERLKISKKQRSGYDFVGGQDGSIKAEGLLSHPFFSQ